MPRAAKRRLVITVRPGTRRLLPVAELRQTLDRALDAAGAPAGAEVGLTLTGDRELADINAAQMGHEGPTDVLSFPLLDPSAFPARKGQDPDLRTVGETTSGTIGPFVLPPDVPIHLGEIVVSVERAVEQATEGRGGQTGDVRWSASDELRLLVTHGALHLCGWDHARPDEEAAMRALERTLLGLESDDPQV